MSKQHINVLQVLGNSIVGGMETYVERLTEHLQQAGINIVCTCPFESPLTARLRGCGVKVAIVRMPDDGSWHSIQMLASLIDSEGIDVIHCHLANAHTIAAIAGRLTGVSVLATIHGRAVSMQDFEVHRLAETTVVVVCQQSYLHGLALGIRRELLHCIPNGVDAEVFDNEARPAYLHRLLNIPTSTPLVGFVGRLSPEKGPEVFVRAAAAARALDARANFVLVGDGPLRQSLETLVASENLDRCFHFVGVQEDMPGVYASLACIVSSSHSEGMPLAIMEAMASRRVVVATHVGGVGEIVEHGATGFLVAPNDSSAIASHICVLLGNPLLRKRMGDAARARAIAEFPFKPSAVALENLLRSMVGSQATTKPLEIVRDR